MSSDLSDLTAPPSTPPAPAPVAPPELAAQGLTLAYGKGPVIVHELDALIPTGKITTIVGANGCGKSTLLRALARLLAPRSGTVLLDGGDIHRLPTREVARRLGLLPQSPSAPEGVVVEDLVRRGRYPHQRLFDQWSSTDQAAVDRALALTGVEDFRQRPVDELSGGQRQRVWIAMTLAQDTPLLLLDEPTTFLDIAHQMDILELLADLNRAEGRTVVMVLHDLNQACRYADHLIAMAEGAVAATGSPSDVVTPHLIEKVFGLPVTVIDDPVTATPLCVPLGRRATRNPANHE